MDTGKGNFKIFENTEEIIKAYKDFKIEKNDNLVLENFIKNELFKEGEIVEIKESRFEISKIIQNGLKLRLLPKEVAYDDDR